MKLMNNDNSLNKNNNYLIRQDGIFNSFIGNMTLNQLIENSKKFSYEKNKINIITETDDKILSIELTEYPNGSNQNIYCFEKLNNKKDYKNTIEIMREEGMSQTEIAHKLGISQGYVSKLLK